MSGPIDRHAMMNSGLRFKQTDVVYHPTRPEWGQGIVQKVEGVTHQGRKAQRLTIDFAHKGRVVINTAVITLSTKGCEHVMKPTTTEADGLTVGWLSNLERQNNGAAHELWQLPEAMTDPFVSPTRRLQATLDSFRFSTEPRSLIEWAVAQTGLDDPLTKYTRHELEQAFSRFKRDRDVHLVDMVRTFKRNGDAKLLHDAMRTLHLPAAKQALAKAMNN